MKLSYVGVRQTSGSGTPRCDISFPQLSLWFHHVFEDREVFSRASTRVWVPCLKVNPSRPMEHKPAWPNGYGVGLLNRRLRVRVPPWVDRIFLDLAGIEPQVPRAFECVQNFYISIGKRIVRWKVIFGRFYDWKFRPKLCKPWIMKEFEQARFEETGRKEIRWLKQFHQRM